MVKMKKHKHFIHFLLLVLNSQMFPLDILKTALLKVFVTVFLKLQSLA